MKKLIIVLMTLGSASAFAQNHIECQDGQIATVMLPFKSDGTDGRIRTIETGTLVQFDTIIGAGNRYIVDLAIVKGTGVRPILNNRNEIVGCSVNTQRMQSHHLCVGNIGYCAATYAPKKLIFLECELDPNR